jgi:NAD-dependent DNA ligase
MGIFSRLIDSVAPEVIVDVRPAKGPTPLSASQVRELIGACRGVLADGKVVEPEAKFLLDWLQQHQDLAGQWPHQFLYERIARIMADGKVTDTEEKELLDTIAKVTDAPAQGGAGRSKGKEQLADDTNAFRYDDPPPHIDFKGRAFCVIGQFVYAPRSEVEKVITSRGGTLVADPSASSKPDYVLVGSVGTRKALRADDAQRIEKALKLHDKGEPVAVVSERHWVKFI